MTDEHVRNQVVKSVQRAYSMEMNKHVPNGQRRSVNIHKIADTAIDAYESALEEAGYAVVPVVPSEKMITAADVPPLSNMYEGRPRDVAVGIWLDMIAAAKEKGDE